MVFIVYFIRILPQKGFQNSQSCIFMSVIFSTSSVCVCLCVCVCVFGVQIKHKVRCESSFKNAGHGIISVTEAEKAQLIVMGTRGYLTTLPLYISKRNCMPLLLKLVQIFVVRNTIQLSYFI